MQNVWKRLRTTDVEQAMRLVYCEEKYLSGRASDFECFREWLSVIGLFEGNRTANDFAQKISLLLGEDLGVCELSHCSAQMLWKRCNEALLGTEYTHKSEDRTEYISTAFKYVTDGEDIGAYADGCTVVTEAVRNGATDIFEIRDAFEALTARRISFCPTSKEFVRPDRYHAALDLTRVQTEGSRCSDILLCQTVCELCFTSRETVRLSICCEERTDYAEGVVRYFSDRGLSVRVFLIVGVSEKVEDILRICKAGRGECVVTPAVIFAKGESEACQKQFLSRLSKIYPIGAVRIVKK